MLINTLADYLAQEGLGTVGTNIFVGHLPASPATALALFATGGFPADGAYPLDEPTVQVRSRSNDPVTAFAQVASVYSVLHGAHHLTLPDGTWLLNCLGLQSAPIGIGRDEAGRDEYTLNFRLTIRSQTANRD